MNTIPKFLSRKQLLLSLFSFNNILTPGLADCLSYESERRQVSSSPQDSAQ